MNCPDCGGGNAAPIEDDPEFGECPDCGCHSVPLGEEGVIAELERRGHRTAKSCAAIRALAARAKLLRLALGLSESERRLLRRVLAAQTIWRDHDGEPGDRAGIWPRGIQWRAARRLIALGLLTLEWLSSEDEDYEEPRQGVILTDRGETLARLLPVEGRSS